MKSNHNRYRYKPLDGMVYPRFSGIRTFMRLPQITDLIGVDFAIVGIPFDTGGTYRVGARFGPEAIRSASVLLRPYHPEHEIAIFDICSGIDFGDLPVVPGYLPQSHEKIRAGAAKLFEASVTPMFVGGDHSVTLPLLRAAHAVFGPVALVHFDAHGDVWEGYFGGLDTHGTPFRRAVEEGLIDLSRSIQIGLRGSVYARDDIQVSRDLGFEVVTASELHQRGVASVLQLIRDRVGIGKTYLSFDIDFVDPAYAPGTGTPETGGFTGAECHQLIRGLTGIEFIAYDLVEVMPSYDPAGITALLAANMIYEFIALDALSRQLTKPIAQSEQVLPQGVVAGSIPLSAGHPAHELLPVLEVKRATDVALQGASVHQMFNYGDEQGDRRLVAFLADRFNRTEHLNITPDNLMIVAGSTAAVDMITRHCTDPGDGILVESPTYRDALHIFRDAKVELHSVAMDGAGIIIDELTRTLEHLQAEERLPQLYYTVPNFHNPTGVTISRERREQIVRLSEQYGFIIVEDDVYHDIHFGAEMPPSFFALADGERVLRIGSFSKTLAPGLRLGWLIGTPENIARFTSSGRARMGGGANPFVAAIVAEYCNSGAWDSHIGSLQTIYQQRRDTALAALERHMPSAVSWTVPAGGYFIWLTLPMSIQVTDLEEAANRRNVYFAPGTGFFVQPEEGKCHLRISYSFVSLADIETGIETLAELIRKLDTNG